MALLLLGAAVIGGGGFLVNHLLGVVGRAEGAVEGIANDLKEFLVKTVWPNVLPLSRIAATLLLVFTVLQCDAFLKATPRSMSEKLLAYCVYYSCWMCALYFILNVLVDDVLKVKNDRVRNLLRTVVITLGLLLPLWEFRDDLFVLTYMYLKRHVILLLEYCGDFLVLTYAHLKAYTVMFLECILSFTPFSKN